jgi:hypothetical protein
MGPAVDDEAGPAVFAGTLPVITISMALAAMIAVFMEHAFPTKWIEVSLKDARDR